MLSPRAPAVPMGLQVSAFPLPQAPRVGLEPTTTRLTAECSTIELSRIIRSVPSKPNTASLLSSLRFHIRYPTGLLPASPVLSDNSCTSLTFWISPRPISTYQLSTLLHLHLKPIYLVVFKGSYYLTVGISHLEGGFTLRCLQRLSLPDLATLPWHWLPTGTPVVRPSRSSRTKDSSSQISYAHAG